MVRCLNGLFSFNVSINAPVNVDRLFKASSVSPDAAEEPDNVSLLNRGSDESFDASCKTGLGSGEITNTQK